MEVLNRPDTWGERRPTEEVVESRGQTCCPESVYLSLTGVHQWVPASFLALSPPLATWPLHSLYSMECHLDGEKEWSREFFFWVERVEGGHCLRKRLGALTLELYNVIFLAIHTILYAVNRSCIFRSISLLM